MSMNKKFVEIILGWIIFFSWLTLTMLIAVRILSPFAIQGLLDSAKALSAEIVSMIKFFTVWLLCVLTGFLVYYIFNRVFTRFSRGTSLWKWFHDIEKQTVEMIRKKGAM
jgi:hypothetical protein